MENQDASSDPTPVTWDTEEDHLLSYFLEDSSQQQTGHSQSHIFGRSHEVGLQNLTISHHGRVAPSTPAVHFYAASKPSAASSNSAVPRAAPVESASSSSSSLSSMAATLVSGGPVLYNIAPRPSSMSPTTSPISPAATMGTPQEQLMLPPPSRPKTEAERQQHIAWLNQINAMAMMNRQASLDGGQHQTQPVMSSHAGGGAHMPLPIHASTSTAGGVVVGAMSQAHYSIATSVAGTQSAVVFSGRPPQQESEEKRAKRLARNRESARQSRRRKKERLNTLSKQVNGLYSEIEAERRVKMNEMEENLQKIRLERIQQLSTDFALREQLEELLETMGPNSAIRQNVVSFQYPALRQLMLPKYQVFMLWLTIQREGFFSIGKDEHFKQEKDAGRANNRISSKQIGEELTSEWKKVNGKREAVEFEDALQAPASEPARLWPLFCFDMSISVDQEEKLVALHKQAQEMTSLADDRNKMSEATKIVVDLKRGILNHLQSTAGRSENLFLQTLNPNQSAIFLKWYAENSERVKETSTVQGHDINQEAHDNKENSISYICKRLKQVLKLPETGDDVGYTDT